jgi:glycosyltransferase involved in cell wall biosynthesis
MNGRRSQLAAVSVVIPVWDRYCTLLPEAVESVLRQAGVDLQLIVVDNASTVELPPLPQQATVLRAPTRVSAGSARNLGLGQVIAPTVLFLDADDILLPGSLAHLAALLHSRPGAVAAVGKRLLWYPDSGAERINEGSPRPLVYGLCRWRRIFAALTLRYDVFQLTGCALLDSSAVRDARGFGDASLAEDWMLRSALATRGRIVFSRDCVVRFRVSPDSLWHRPHTRQELERAYADFRTHRLDDDKLPRWSRVAMPLIESGHRRDIRARTAHGPFQPTSSGGADA